MRELVGNVSLRVEDTDSPEQTNVVGRGELQLSILIEMMRREGFEIQVSRPDIVTKQINGVKMEPIEDLVIDVPEDFQGVVIAQAGMRRGVLSKMVNHGSGRVRLDFRIPARGLIGFRSQFMTDTRGTGIMNPPVRGVGAMARCHRRTRCWCAGCRPHRRRHRVRHLQSPGAGRDLRGAGTKVYEGMIIGENARQNDMDVNVTKEKNRRTCARRAPMKRFA